MPDSNPRAYAEHLAAASPLARAALSFGDLVADVDEKRAEMTELREQAGVIAVDTDWKVPHLAELLAGETLCGQRKGADIDTTRAGRIADFCPACVAAARDRAGQ